MASSVRAMHGEADREEQLLVGAPAGPPGQREPAVGDELRRRARRRDGADQARRLGLGQQLQLQRDVDGLEVVEADRHDEGGDEHARQRREIAGERHAEPEDEERGIGQHLLAHQQQPEDGGEGEEARDLAHALRKPGLEPLEAGPLDGEVVEQRRPAGVAQVVDERQRAQEDDRRWRRMRQAGL